VVIWMLLSTPNLMMQQKWCDKMPISCPIIYLRKKNHLFFCGVFWAIFCDLDYTKCANPHGLNIMGKPNNICTCKYNYCSWIASLLGFCWIIV
jgi:hypothetical protein